MEIGFLTAPFATVDDALSVVDRLLPIHARPRRQGSPSLEDSTEHLYDAA